MRRTETLVLRPLTTRRRGLLVVAGAVALLLALLSVGVLSCWASRTPERARANATMTILRRLRILLGIFMMCLPGR